MKQYYTKKKEHELFKKTTGKMIDKLMKQNKDL